MCLIFVMGLKMYRKVFLNKIFFFAIILADWHPFLLPYNGNRLQLVRITATINKLKFLKRTIFELN